MSFEDNTGNGTVKNLVRSMREVNADEGEMTFDMDGKKVNLYFRIEPDSFVSKLFGLGVNMNIDGMIELSNEIQRLDREIKTKWEVFFAQNEASITRGDVLVLPHTPSWVLLPIPHTLSRNIRFSEFVNAPTFINGDAIESLPFVPKDHA